MRDIALRSCLKNIFKWKDRFIRCKLSLCENYKGIGVGYSCVFRDKDIVRLGSLGVHLALRNIIFVFILFPLQAFSLSDHAVTLIFYVDLSESVQNKTEAIARVASVAQEELEASCGPAEYAVSNLQYWEPNQKIFLGGELIFEEGGEPFITNEVDGGGDIIARRLMMGYTKIARFVTKLDGSNYFVNGFERTYASVIGTIASHLRQSPRLSNRQLVASLMITDAVPGFELVGSAQAVEDIKARIGGRDYMAGVIGAIGESCRDSSLLYSRNEQPGGYVHSPESLIQTTRFTDGYYGSICDVETIEEKVRAFIKKIIKRAGCNAYV